MTKRGIRWPFLRCKRMLVQDLTRHDHLAPDECAEAPGWGQQSIDQAHVGINLRRAGARVGLRQQDGGPTPNAESWPTLEDSISGQADHLLGYPRSHQEDAVESWVRADRLVKRAWLLQGGAEGIPPRADIGCERQTAETVPSVVEQQCSQFVNRRGPPGGEGSSIGASSRSRAKLCSYQCIRQWSSIGESAPRSWVSAKCRSGRPSLSM